jgi:hypothetical protein
LSILNKVHNLIQDNINIKIFINVHFAPFIGYNMISKSVSHAIHCFYVDLEIYISKVTNVDICLRWNILIWCVDILLIQSIMYICVQVSNWIYWLNGFFIWFMSRTQGITNKLNSLHCKCVIWTCIIWLHY